MIRFSKIGFVYIEESKFNRKDILHEYGLSSPNTNCKFIITRNNKPIKVLSYFDILLKRSISENIFVHSPSIFSESHNYFKNLNNKNLGSCCGVTDSNSKLMYILEYINNTKFVNYTQQDYFFSFDDYDYLIEEKDLQLFQKYRTIIFESLEEYTYHIASLLINKNINISIFFYDKSASLFFDKGKVSIIDSDNNLDFLTNSCLYICSNKSSQDNKAKKKMSPYLSIYHSLELMTLLYGQKEKLKLATNETKPFYIFNSKFRSGGLGDIIKFSLPHCITAESNGYVPIINLNKMCDQYRIHEGDNIWEYYFKPISNYSIEQAYASDHYILSESNMPSPYNKKTLLENKEIDVMRLSNSIYQSKFQLKDEVEDYCKSELSKIFSTKKKILGVISRGTDYNADAVIYRYGQNKSNNIEGNELIPIVEYLVKKNGFDYIYLATEDINNYEMFQKKFHSIMISTEQERVTTAPSNYIADVPKQKCNYEIGLDYITVLYSLAHCNSLLSSMYCGAYSLAQWLNKSTYENIYLAHNYVGRI